MKASLLILILLLSGCSSLPRNSGPSLEIDVPSTVSSEKGDAHISLVRNKSFAGSLIYYWPSYSGHVLAGMPTGSYLEFYVPKGKTTLGVSCYGGWGQSWKKRKIVLSLASGDEHYYLLSPSFSDRNQCVDIEPISKQAYQARIAHSTKLKL